MLGLHGRRHPGPGETFWQFRPYVAGEPARQIDWRRSAHDDHLYVREREWEASQTVWLWTDLSSSMDFRSRLSDTTKLDRALVLMLALAEMLARGGERVGMPGLAEPRIGRDAADRLAEVLAHNEAAAGLAQPRSRRPLLRRRDPQRFPRRRRTRCETGCARSPAAAPTCISCRSSTPPRKCSPMRAGWSSATRNRATPGSPSAPGACATTTGRGSRRIAS